MSVFGGGARMGGHRRIERIRAPLGNGSRTTSFPTVENPISEGGIWLNGAADGLDWNNMQVAVAGKCYGRQNLDAPTAGTTRDGTAILKGTFTANQFAEATVYVDSLTGTAFPEVELRLRSTIGAHVNSGYEIGYSANSDGSAYLIIVRWNGAQASYDYLYNSGAGGFPGVVTGDVIRAEISGNTLTAKLNGSTLATVDITSIGGTVFTSGNPGIGHNSEDATGASNSQYGFTTFSGDSLS
jgi:hypothetical protein